MVAEKDINNPSWNDLDKLIFDHPGISNIKDLRDLEDHAQTISDIIVKIVADIITEYVITRIRIEEPYLIYTQQERL